MYVLLGKVFRADGDTRKLFAGDLIWSRYNGERLRSAGCAA